MDDPEIASIDAALKAKGHSRADLGRLLGLDSAQVSRMFSGRRRLQRHEAARVNEWLGNSAASVGGSVVPMPGMVPVYGWVGAASDTRLTIADQAIRSFVPRHPAQANLKNAFALQVADISMIPRYEPGEIVYVAPDQWPSRGQDCVIVTQDGHGFLKRFVNRTHELIVAHQYNPDQDIDFNLAAVTSIHSVVGRG